MITRLIGDIHCNINSKVLMSPNSIQLGDLCLFNYNKFEFKDNKPRYFIDGNHDHHPSLQHNSKKIQKIKNGLYYIPRGYISKETLFIGGADSIDKGSRTPGYDFFYEETISENQLYDILNKGNKTKIKAIVSHSCPLFILKKIVPIIYNNFIHTSRCLELIYEKFQPSLWIFSHYHLGVTIQYNNCKFICVNMDSLIKVDLPINNNLEE